MVDYLQILSAIALVFIAVYYYLTSSFDFWKSRGVAGPKPVPIFGNAKDIILRRTMLGVYLKGIYNEYKNEPLIGIFMKGSPVAVICDLNLVKDILIKDFSVFDDRGKFIHDRVYKIDPLAQNLFNLEAKRWRPLRSRLSPVFTSGKLKEMFPLILECSEQLEKHLEKLEEKGELMECREVAARYTTDVIGSCAFGINMNALSDEECQFRRIGKIVLSTSWSTLIRQQLQEYAPGLYCLAMSLRPLTKVTKFFTRVITETIKYREENNVTRPDFVNMLIELKNHPDKLQNIEMTDSLLTAQAFVFFVAGFETSSTTICHALYEMALNPQMQDKLRAEMMEFSAKNNGVLKYGDVKELKYLDKVFKETLRKYPVGTILRRCNNRDYTFNGTKVTVPKGTRVFVPVYGIHHDPNIYPNPEVFDPERFNEDAVAARHPMSFLPFGDGPRNCIGTRFAIYQTKVGLIKILRRFKVSVCEKTMIPYEIDTRSLILGPNREIYVKISKVEV